MTAWLARAAGVVLPWWARWAALAIALVAVWAYGFTCGQASTARAWDAERAARERAEAATVSRLARRASEIELVWINTTTTVHEQARTLAREVRAYVSEKSDRECVVPAGFVGLWNQPLAARLYDPATAPGGADRPAGVALSAVAEHGVVEAKRRFELNRAALAACQAWARAVTTPR